VEQTTVDPTTPYDEEKVETISLARF
jgi:hypothetical protein